MGGKGAEFKGFKGKGKSMEDSKGKNGMKGPWGAGSWEGSGKGWGKAGDMGYKGWDDRNSWYYDNGKGYWDDDDDWRTDAYGGSSGSGKGVNGDMWSKGKGKNKGDLDGSFSKGGLLAKGDKG